MDWDWRLWLTLAARWTHIFASILWVGTTYYFTWLDGRFGEQEKDRTEGGKGAQVWMVHSGGFYKVEKTKVFDVAHPLHWFRWEAIATWTSGMVLLVLVYWMGGAMVDSSIADLTNGRAVAIGAAVLIVGWIVYDGMMQSPIGRSETLAATLGFAVIVLLSWSLSRWLSGRAVYMHVGALFGTIMANNVVQRIIPTQRKMVAAIREGRTPDAALGARAKLRSKQNTFLAVPVVFLMMSNHFPTASYGSRWSWQVLCVMVLVGWAVARWIRRA
jgi:uncharacterized membrane protein